jgi:membrane associated rhomboid family serine protease
MIIPGFFYLIFQRPKLSLAWAFLFANLVIYFYTSLAYHSWPSSTLLEKVKDKNFSVSLIEMYKQTLDPIEVAQMKDSPTLSEALRDHRFWKKVSHFPFKGDQVQIELNRRNLVSFQGEYFSSSQYLLGLGPLDSSPWAWVTYQFTHASFLHLFGNVMIIFLLISYLETSVGLFWLISVYLFGGFGGGMSYLLFDGSGSMSVVGASASAFSLMAFLIVIKKNELMPWSYVIAPVPQGYGIIYLPVFFIFPMFLMTDFITVLWEPAGVTSSVALSAHIGGAFVGFILGLAYLCEQELTKFLIRIWQIDERKISELDL